MSRFEPDLDTSLAIPRPFAMKHVAKPLSWNVSRAEPEPEPCIVFTVAESNRLGQARRVDRDKIP